MTTREELVKQAAELVPVLRERAAETEKQRQALPDTVENLKASQLITLAQPRR